MHIVIRQDCVGCIKIRIMTSNELNFLKNINLNLTICSESSVGDHRGITDKAGAIAEGPISTAS